MSLITAANLRELRVFVLLHPGIGAARDDFVAHAPTRAASPLMPTLLCGAAPWAAAATLAAWSAEVEWSAGRPARPSQPERLPHKAAEPQPNTFQSSRPDLRGLRQNPSVRTPPASLTVPEALGVIVTAPDPILTP